VVPAQSGAVAHLNGVKTNTALSGLEPLIGVEELSEYLDGVRASKYSTPKPARTAPLPPEPERTYPKEKFTVGKAIGNGVGGVVLGLMGGGILGGIVLIVAALSRPRRREGRA